MGYREWCDVVKDQCGQEVSLPLGGVRRGVVKSLLLFRNGLKKSGGSVGKTSIMVEERKNNIGNRRAYDVRIIIRNRSKNILGSLCFLGRGTVTGDLY